MIRRGLGYLPDPADDGRDRPFGRPRIAARAAASLFDDRVQLVRDQVTSSSCTGQAVAGAVEVRDALDGVQRVIIRSALGLYWPGRERSGLHRVDGGAYIRDVLWVAHRRGVPSEQAWPFQIDRINDRPSIAAEVDGLARANGVYERVFETGAARVEAVLDALQDRCPVILGTDITDAFVAAGGDTVPAPKPGDRRLGGHAIYLVGFDRSGERVRCVNSWGGEWGDGGLCWLDSGWLADWTTRDVWALRPAPTGATA